ncbi:MAG: class II aldolase/adducin family protein [Alphaproteobacteria bacterium]|nr:class II aldolase/adducin family protein [Alphaproteobacteria bacterium]
MATIDTRLAANDPVPQIRARVAACTRLLNMAGILHYSGHVSQRAPGEDALYIQSRGESRAEVTPASVLKVDFDGNVLEGDDKPPSELVIHTGIYRARPDIGAVIHNHMPMAAALTMARGARFEVMDFHAAHWVDGVRVMRAVGHIKTEADGAALAACLGDGNALLLRAHGLVLTAESAPGLLVDTLHFEDNVNALKQAFAFSRSVEPVAGEDFERIGLTEDREHRVRKMWNYYVLKGVRAGAIPECWQGYPDVTLYRPGEGPRS